MTSLALCEGIQGDRRDRHSRVSTGSRTDRQQNKQNRQQNKYIQRERLRTGGRVCRAGRGGREAG